MGRPHQIPLLTDASPRVRRRHPEQTLQQHIAAYLAAALAAPVWFTAIGHGGGGGLRGKILLGMGVKAGVPDLLVLYDGRAFFIEVKSAKGSLSAVQRECHTALAAAGCRVGLARSLDDIAELLRHWSIPTRISTPIGHHNNAPEA